MAADFVRDRWGRPMVTPKDGGKPVPYTRFSSHGQCLEDRFGLEKWKIRTTALGLVTRQDLMAQVASIPTDDKSRLDDVLSQALEAGGGSVGANLGTALHEFTQRYDLGEIMLADIPDPWREDVRAYADTIETNRLQINSELVEVTLVNDDLQLAGTADRFYRMPSGTLVCADLKTGKAIGQNPLGYIVQLAAYANSVRYDTETGQRSSLGTVNLNTGYLIHVPAGQAKCDIYEVDLVAGLEAAKLASEVRAWQKKKHLVAQIPPVKAVSTETPLEAVLTAFEGSCVVASQERREWLKNRISRLISVADAKKELVALWPTDIPKLSTDHEHSDSELDQIIQIVDALEDAHQLPFFTTDPNTPPPAKPAKKKATKLVIETIDEGAEVSADDVTDVKQALALLNRQQLAFISSVADHAANIGRSISLRANPTVRRLKLSYALIDLAEATIDETGDTWMAEALIRNIANNLHDPVGTVVGNMTIDEIDNLKHLVSDLNDGLVTITVDDNGTTTITQTKEK